MEPTTQGPSGNTSTATKPTTYTLPLVHTDCRALLRATQIKTEARESALRRLRPLRSSAKYQRRYLDGTIKRFVRLVEAGLEGEHFHRDLYDFFADDENRLSTSIVETPESVAPRLRTRRRNRDYEQSDPQSPSDEQNTLTSCGLFVAYLETVVSQYDLSRQGKTASRHIPVSVLTTIFREQSGPWKQICEDHISQCATRSRRFLITVIAHIAPNSTADLLLEQRIHPGLDQRTSKLDSKLQELLWPY